MADQNVDVNINVKKPGGDLDKEVDLITKAAKGAAEEVGQLDTEVSKTYKGLKQLGAIGGKALTGIGNAGKAAFKAIGTAIKAAGIGLLIGLLATLWEAIKKNQQVMDLFSTAVNALGIIIQPIAKGIGDLVTGIANGSDKFDAFGKVIKNVIIIALKPFQLVIQGIKISVFSLMIAWEKLSSALSKKKTLDEGKIAEWKGEIDEAKERVKELAVQAGESFTEIKDNMGEAIDEMKTFGKGVIDGIKEAVVEVQSGAAQAATEAVKNMERLQLVQDRLMLQYQTLAEQQRQLRDNEASTIDERIMANMRLGEILNEQAAAEIDAVNQQIEAQKAILKLDESNIEAQNKIYELETKKIDINERILGQQSEQLTQINSLNKEKEEAAKADIERTRSVADEIRAIEQELAIGKLEDANEAALLKLEYDQENFERELEQRLANEEITQEELFKIKALYGEQYAINVAAINDVVEKDNEETTKANIAIAKEEAQAKIDGALAAAGALLGAADAVFGETKASAIAQTIITTYQSATSAFSALAGIPIVGPILGGIAAAAAVISGLAQVNKIRQQDKPGAGQAQAKLSANKNPVAATGGYVVGPSHNQGGVDVNMEGGEGILSRATMGTSIGQAAMAANNGMGDFVTRTELNALKVYIIESEITKLQKQVAVRESAYTK